MRLFIAAELPEVMMDALAETQAMLRDTIRGRFTAPNGLHVTLAFLGEVPHSRIAEINRALEDACLCSNAFHARLGDFGSFGKRDSAIVWQGFSHPAPFTDLAQNVRRELDAIGVEYDRRSLKAHVTLMRRANLADGSLPTPICAAGVISAITLFASELTPRGPIYTPLHTVELTQ